MKRRWQDWMTLVLGAWLFSSPFLMEAYFPYPSVDDWNSYMGGAALIVVSTLALKRPERWEEWFNLLIGGWLIVSPFLLGFSEQTVPTWNQIIVGAIVVLDALWVLGRRRHLRQTPLPSR